MTSGSVPLGEVQKFSYIEVPAQRKMQKKKLINNFFWPTILVNIQGYYFQRPLSECHVLYVFLRRLGAGSLGEGRHFGSKSTYF